LLGTGPEADRHKRLRDLALKQDAEAKAKWDADIVQANSDKDGNLMVQLGYAQVSAGQADAGLKLIEQGIAKDKLKRPEDAKLHLGIAQLLAGKKAKAQQTLRSVGGTDGTADLARLWIIQSNQGNQQ
jgi:Tfp pilus assembly protein PilF